VDVSRVAFIPPALPKLRSSPPSGDQWLHEVKLDGFRVQLHKAERAVTIYSRNGADFTRRFPAIATAVLALPVSSCIIDGELVAPGASGEPDFRELLHGRVRGACVYAFDLFMWKGRDIRERPLEQRRARLEALLKRASTRLIRFSDDFPDAGALLAACARRGLEGIVSKRKDSAYRSGVRSGWVKVKTSTWRAANRERWRLFEKR
jgi:bifunctional non-homologous end joining protein LigD